MTEQNQLKKIKDYIIEEKEKIKHNLSTLDTPVLAIVQVGDNPASNSYIKGKRNDCYEVGIEVVHQHFAEDVETETIIHSIETLNNNLAVKGIIVQLPLPLHVDIEKIQNTVSLEKDVDGFGHNSKFMPCTPKGVIDYLIDSGYNFTNKKIGVVGRGFIGKPLAQKLMELGSKVVICHSQTPNIKEEINGSDLVFTCIDKIEHFDTNIFNCDVIDIGLGKGEDGKLHGNLKREVVDSLRKQGHTCISGTGGVGLLTRLALMKNTVLATQYMSRAI